MCPTTPSPDSEPGRWRDVTFVFGGTFDPPHLGHREAVLDLARRFRPARILILPAGDPPLKSATTDAQLRLEMARISFDFDPSETSGCPVLVDDREIRQPGRSYTSQTLEALQRVYGDLAFVCGTDQLYQMKRWHRFPELLDLADWIFLLRRPEPESRARAELNRWAQQGLVAPLDDHWTVAGPSAKAIFLAQTPAREISSTEIRADLASGPPPRTVSPGVADYIVRNGLYRAPSGESEP